MKAFSYVVETDSGFAPNPFWGYCTLATCKPRIRKAAKVGDWVFGFGPASWRMEGKLIFAMRVDEVIPFEIYDQDPRFQSKKPSFSGTFQQRCGDTIYFKDPNNGWQQRESFHCEDDVKHNLSGINILVSQYFWYFGKKAPLMQPEHKEIIKKGRGHNSSTNPSVVDGVIDWLKKTWPLGIHGEPVDPNTISFGNRKITSTV